MNNVHIGLEILLAVSVCVITALNSSEQDVLWKIYFFLKITLSSVQNETDADNRKYKQVMVKLLGLPAPDKIRHANGNALAYPGF